MPEHHANKQHREHDRWIEPLLQERQMRRLHATELYGRLVDRSTGERRKVGTQVNPTGRCLDGITQRAVNNRLDLLHSLSVPNRSKLVCGETTYRSANRLAHQKCEGCHKF